MSASVKVTYQVTGIDPVVSARRLLKSWERNPKMAPREFEGVHVNEAMAVAINFAKKERPREVLSANLDSPQSADRFAEIARANNVEGVQVESRRWTVSPDGKKQKMTADSFLL